MNPRASARIVLVLAMLAAACSGPTAAPTYTQEDPQPSMSGSMFSRGGSGPSGTEGNDRHREDRHRGDRSGARHGPSATVLRAIDGDTIEVRFHGRSVDVRLIGIDTPESVSPTVGVECYGKAASAFTGRRLTGRRVQLEFDVERKDRYGRTLAYVWRGGMFNQTLVRRGFATAYPYPPNTRYEERFARAESSARHHRRGLWKGCRSRRPGGGSGGGGSGGGGRHCDPAYPGACIPPPPPDLDCSDIRFHDFRVRRPDPHNFDGNGDGRGCE